MSTEYGAKRHPHMPWCDEGGSHVFETWAGLTFCTNGCFKHPDRAAPAQEPSIMSAKTCHIKIGNIEFDVEPMDHFVSLECPDEPVLTLDDLKADLRELFRNPPRGVPLVSEHHAQHFAAMVADYLDENGWIAEADEDDDTNWLDGGLHEHVNISVTQVPGIGRVSFGEVKLLGQVATGRELDHMAAMATRDICRAPGETDESLRERVLAELRAPVSTGYHVGPRDSLSSIADRYSVSIDQAQRIRDAELGMEHLDHMIVAAHLDGFELGTVTAERNPLDSAVQDHPAPTYTPPDRTPAGNCLQMTCGTCPRCKRYMGVE